MSARESTFFCIDMKTFYASVECAERGLNPFETNLVVADLTRGQKCALSRSQSEDESARSKEPLSVIGYP